MMVGVVLILFVAALLPCVQSFTLEEFHESLPKNISAEHRRLAVDYWTSLKNHFQIKLFEEALRNNTDYRNKQPFPYTYIDGLFPQDVIEAAEQEIPDNPKLTAAGCVKGSQQCFQGKDFENKKNAFEDEISMGPATVTLFAFMKSKLFIHFLEKLTGINDIIPDPAYLGSGIHQTLSGGHLSLHADFNRYLKYDLHRRVNCFIYLNPKWEDSFGGHLELWSKDLSTCAAKISPDINRFVVFSTTDFSYHGHPNALTCPQTRSRRSLALYYYTRTRPAHECLENDCSSSHNTIFVKGKCAECSEKTCAGFTYGRQEDLPQKKSTPAKSFFSFFSK